MVRSVLRHKETQVIIVNLVAIHVLLYLMMNRLEFEFFSINSIFSIATIVVLLLAVKLLKTHPSVVWQATCALITGFSIPVVGLVIMHYSTGMLVDTSIIFTFKWVMVGLVILNAILFRWLEKGRFKDE